MDSSGNLARSSSHELGGRNELVESRMPNVRKAVRDAWKELCVVSWVLSNQIALMAPVEVGVS